MANQRTVVGLVSQFETADHRPMSMTGDSADVFQWIANGACFHVSGCDRQLCLDSGAPFADVDGSTLRDLQAHSWPAYLETSETDNGRLNVTRLLVPKIAHVRDLSVEFSGDCAVLLRPSPITHRIKRSNPRCDEFYATLAGARRDNSYVVVTNSRDFSEIIDVRRQQPPLRPFSESCRLGRVPQVMKTEAQIIAEIDPSGVITERTVSALFAKMHDRTCFGNFSRQCIPFMFAFDGCHARAHEMCELMQTQEATRAAKIWLYPSANVPGLLPPRNSLPPPLCGQHWRYHVAPMVRVGVNGAAHWRVIDPGLFRPNEAVPTIRQWIDRQGDPHATFVITESALVDQDVRGQIDDDDWDPDFCRARSELVEYRARLRDQIRDHGEPPYSC